MVPGVATQAMRYGCNFRHICPIIRGATYAIVPLIKEANHWSDSWKCRAYNAFIAGICYLILYSPVTSG